MQFIKRRIERRIEYWKALRHDKLKLLIAMLLVGSTPILVCYGIPGLIAYGQEQSDAAVTATAQAALAAFRAEYADQIALCDTEGGTESQGRLPAHPRMIVIEYGSRASAQSDLPAAWQPQSPADVSVVVCLGRQRLEPVEACLNGAVPDFSPYAGYEAGSIDPSAPNMGETIGKHPDYTGQTILRYATDVTAYDTASGQLILRSTMWGADPPICTMTDLSGLSIPEILSGPRTTDADILSWLTETFGAP